MGSHTTHLVMQLRKDMRLFHMKMAHEMERYLHKNFDLNLPQFIALVHLFEHGKLKMNSMRKIMFVSSPAATNTVNRLLTMGLVRRSYGQKDRRTVLVDLTNKGKILVIKVNDTINEYFRNILKKLSPDEQRDFVRLNSIFCDTAAKIPFTQPKL